MNSELAIADRKFHLQTSVDDHQIVSSLFDGGALVFKKRFPIETQTESDALENRINRIHDLVKADVEMLFHIAEKVKSSKHLPSMRRLGHLFFEKGFYSDAVAQLSAVIAHQPEDEELEIELATALLYAGDAQKALYYAEKAAAKKPSYPDLQLLLAKINWRLDRFDEARDCINQALSLNPKYWDAYFTLANLLVESVISDPVHANLPPPIERLKEAEQLLRKVQRMSSDLHADKLLEAIDNLKIGGEVEEALSLLSQARKSERNGKWLDSEFYLKFMFGQLADDGRELDYYIQTIQNVLKDNPHYADLHHSLGLAYLLKAWLCFEKSTKEFEKAVQINPDYEKAKKKLKLMQNDGRGLLILLRAVLN
ncbi:MAG: tetratricopeptide repeat protein [candidate division KSB1 bacterium]|nr:tetratricopeptide repeat protein [candidate division KSB1 bacterium]